MNNLKSKTLWANHLLASQKNALETVYSFTAANIHGMRVQGVDELLEFESGKQISQFQKPSIGVQL